MALVGEGRRARRGLRVGSDRMRGIEAMITGNPRNGPPPQPDRDAKIRRLHAQGLTRKELAERFNLSQSRVGSILSAGRAATEAARDFS